MPYFSVLATAFVIACLLTPVAIRIAPKIGAMDIPKDNRRMHHKPMPRFGGMAIFAGTEIALAVFCHSDPKVVTIIIGGILIYAVGVIDDLRGLPAKLKFLLQILCAAIIYVGGIRINFVKNPLSMETYIHFPLVISFIITVIWIVGITNTINLIDGLDGLAAGVAAIASAYISYASVLSGQYGVAAAMMAVTGGALGFLPYNFHPAKIFMGDSGSLYLGFMIGSISVLGSTKGATLIVTIVPFLALGLPIFDTAFAIIRRWVNGQPIMEADKGHVHHRIMNRGMGQRRTVLIMYCISAVMGMVAIMIVKRELIEAAIMIVTAVALLCVFVADHSTLKGISHEGLVHNAENKNFEDGDALNANVLNTESDTQQTMIEGKNGKEEDAGTGSEAAFGKLSKADAPSGETGGASAGAGSAVPEDEWIGAGSAAAKNEPTEVDSPAEKGEPTEVDSSAAKGEPTTGADSEASKDE